MNKQEKAVGVLANGLVAFGYAPPTYPKPKWYQFSLKRKLRYYDKVGWPYKLEANK